MDDTVFEIFHVNHRRLIRFLPTDHEDTWSDWCDGNLNGLRGPSEVALTIGEGHDRLGFEAEVVNPTLEIGFVHATDSRKASGGHSFSLTLSAHGSYAAAQSDTSDRAAFLPLKFLLHIKGIMSI
jgi:hypothetical protein